MEWKKAGLNDEKGEPVYYTEVPFVVKLGETTGLKVKVTTITFAVKPKSVGGDRGLVTGI